MSYTKDRLDFEDDCLIEGILNSDGVKELIDNAQNYRPEEENIIYVESESELPSSRGKPKPKQKPKSEERKDSESSGRRSRSKSDIDLTRQMIKKLQASRLLTLGLRHFMEELRYQLVAKRPIAAAVCLRVILEQGLSKRLEIDFPQHFAKNDGKGIQALINYLNSNPNDFFP